MTCDEVREAFSELYDDMLSGVRMTDVTQHLDECPDCRAEWAAFSMTLQVVTRLGTADPSPGFAARLWQRIDAPPWWRRIAHSLFVPLHVKVPIHAVALAVLSFAGIMLFQRSPELRREAEVKVAPPGRVARPAPPAGSSAPTPPIPEKTARAEKGVTAPRPPSKGERGEGRAGPPAAAAPLSLPPKPLAKKEPAPSEDLRPPVLQLQPSAPPPAESRVATGGLAPVNPLAPSRADRLSSVPSGSADELFSGAVTEYARQAYERAIEGFKAFIATYPGDARVPDARFMLGEAHFSRQRYAEAILEFETLIRQFPDSRRIPAALYQQGQARLALGDQTGCQLLRDVAARYPQAREAVSARDTLSARCR